MKLIACALSFRVLPLLLVASLVTLAIGSVTTRDGDEIEVTGKNIIEKRGWRDWVDKVGGIFSPKDPLDSFWSDAEGMKDKLLIFAKDELDKAKEAYKGSAGQIDEVRRSAEQIVGHSETLRAEFERAFAKRSKRGVTEPRAMRLHVQSISKELEEACATAFKELEKAFPPPDQAPGHEKRRELVLRVLNDLKKRFVTIAVKHGVLAEHIEHFFHAIEGPVVAIVVTTGDLVEQHPILTTVVISCVVGLIIPESWVLRPVLNFFGFGPKGPIKGTAAAWMQKRLYGAAIPAKSWFSFLQRKAMITASSSWWKGVVGGVVGAIGGVFGGGKAVSSCGRRR